MDITMSDPILEGRRASNVQVQGFFLFTMALAATIATLEHHLI